LTPREVLLFFLAASFLFIFPLVQADYFYNDDNWRSLVAGEGWREEGRVAIGLFYNAISFGSKAPDLFPLPLFIATAGISFALRSLTFFYFQRPTFVHCLVVLPLWYDPFLLQNLSYHYDGPAMALGLVALIYAVMGSADKAWRNVWAPALLFALALSIYQVLIGFFIAMCCVEVIRLVWLGRPSGQVLRFIASKLLAIIIGVLVYYLTAHDGSPSGVVASGRQQSAGNRRPSFVLGAPVRWLGFRTSPTAGIRRCIVDAGGVRLGRH
jgi:hypothetical protein